MAQEGAADSSASATKPSPLVSHSTKKGTQDFVSITDPFVVQLCRIRKRQLMPGDPFVGMSS
eukprot:15517-Karenia_brevis.AAC.1